MSDSLSATQKSASQERMRKPQRGKADRGLVGALLKYCATQPDVIAERQNAGGKVIISPTGHRHYVKFGSTGALDIRGYVKGEPATPFEAEAKRKGARARESQMARMATLKRIGVPCCKVESVSEFAVFLEGLRRRV